MITAPYMPFPVWCRTGGVPQWYIQMPEWVASNWYTSDSPGPIVRISSSGATSEAWKSSECPFLPSLTSVIVKMSPTLPRSVGAGTCPLNVHISCSSPGAISSIVSAAWIVDLVFGPAGRGLEHRIERFPPVVWLRTELDFLTLRCGTARRRQRWRRSRRRSRRRWPRSPIAIRRAKARRRTCASG